jgi:hypothetical protein
MPVVLRVDGFSFKFYSNDHAPPHVHAFYGGKRCRILLADFAVTFSNMKRSDETHAVRLVVENLETISRAWTEFQLRKIRT